MTTAGAELGWSVPAAPRPGDDGVRFAISAGMARDNAQTSSFVAVDSPLGWTFPAGFILLASSFICLLVFVLYPRTASPACEMQTRLVLSFAIPAGLGGALTPLAIAPLSPTLRAIGAVLAGVAAAALAWVAVAGLFPSFC
jgi:hypothetical protein